MPQKPVRWAHLIEIDNRCKVGSAAWFRRHTLKQQKLSAWRKLHSILTHESVSNSTAVSPSSNMRLASMLKRIREAEGK